MNSKNKWRSMGAAVLMTAFALCLLGTSPANAKWYWGVGTGITQMNIEGDIGLNVDGIGPVQVPVDLDPDEFRDLIETAFGFGGYFTDGKWVIGYKLGFFELLDEPSGTTPGGASYTSEFFFDMTFGEFTIGNVVWKSSNGKMSLTPFVGARYIKHELGSTINVTGIGTRVRSTENEWTDFLIGTSVKYAFAPKWLLSASLDGGFGGSEGTVNFSAGLSWRFWKYMSAGPMFSYKAVEFENGEKGDADWYLYDVDEFGVGASFLFHF
jgi:hypothetical protein